jgi:CheY-like chemotaxis protein
MDSSGILVIDGNAQHREVIAQTLRENGIRNGVEQVSEVAEARDVLCREFEDHPEISPRKPTLILLDASRVKSGAIEFVEWLRVQPTLRRVPVIAMMEKEDPDLLQLLYRAGVNSVLLKPFEPSKLRELIKAINGYWVLMVERPRLEE